MTDSLGQSLVASGAITEAQLREAQAFQRNGALRLGQALQKLGFADERTVARAEARDSGLPFVDLEKGRVPEAVIARVPRELAVEQGLLPVAERNGKLVVAIDDPFKRLLVEQLQFALGVEAVPAIAAPGALQRAIQRAYGASAEAAVASKVGEGAVDPEDAPIIRLVSRTLEDALQARASDVHIEPQAAGLRVRYRVDGMLREVATHPPHLAGPLVSRLKIMGQMDIAERRKPQDGRIELELGGRSVDVRVSILPSNHGETMVLRLLDRSRSLISLRDLGFSEESYAWLRTVISRPHGIVLVTGPTGSGKTTTLYAALSELNRPDVKIITAEDPVEYHIAGINQIQVNQKIGLSFARILKAMLRAAPNIILVGEIRDLETAEVAIQAALTGHLVFSTLHTNDATSAILRLSDMGVAPFLVSTAVQAVIAQRLVRKLCTECAQAYTPGEAELRALALDPSWLAGAKFKRPRGCKVCEGSGYRGRIGLFETLELDGDLREMIFRGANLEAIRAQSLSSGRLQPILRDGAQKLVAGSTSLAELARVSRLATDEAA